MANFAPHRIQTPELIAKVCAWKITSVYVQRLRFVPPWLKSRYAQTDRIDQLIHIIQTAELKITKTYIGLPYRLYILPTDLQDRSVVSLA